MCYSNVRPVECPLVLEARFILFPIAPAGFGFIVVATRQVEFSLFLVRARVKLQAGAIGNKINLAAKTNAHLTGMTIVVFF